MNSDASSLVTTSLNIVNQMQLEYLVSLLGKNSTEVAPILPLQKQEKHN